MVVNSAEKHLVSSILFEVSELPITPSTSLPSQTMSVPSIAIFSWKMFSCHLHEACIAWGFLPCGIEQRVALNTHIHLVTIILSSLDFHYS